MGRVIVEGAPGELADLLEAGDRGDCLSPKYL
jgi:hypothetical protein